MSSNVNVLFSNHRTGTNVAVTRRLVDYTVSWTDDANQPHQASGTLTFPDIFANAGLDPAMVRDDIEALVFKYGRILLGVDAAE